MSNGQSPERLSRELRSRATEAGGHPISLDDVKRSANRMRWQQRAAVGAAAAVVLAIAAPVGISLAGGGNDRTGQVATNTPSPTVGEPSPTPTRHSDGQEELTLDAPEGPAPRVSWLEGTTLHAAGGGTFELPKRYDDVVSYRGGFLGADTGEFTFDEVRDAKVVASQSGTGFAVSADGTQISWFARSGNAGELKRGIASGMGEGEATQEVPDGYDATPVVFRGGGAVVYELRDRDTGQQTVWWTEFDGRAYQIDGAIAVGGWSPATDQVAVMTESTDSGSCWAMYAFPGGESAGGLTDRTCDYQLGDFSADGRYLIGWPAYGDGWGPGEVSILDSETWEPVVRFDSGQDYGVSEAVWDGDDDSLIATVHLDGRWRLLRLGADGSIESASDAVAGDDMAFPFNLVSAR